MTSQQTGYDKLVFALREAMAQLGPRVGQKHNFRFISQSQVFQYEQAEAAWAKSGRIGPAPSAPIPEIRAAIYNQAVSARQLKAVVQVGAVVSFELAETALIGLERKRMTVAYTAMRGLIERIAHLAALSTAVSGLCERPSDPTNPLEPILKLSYVIYRALYGTQVEWTKLDVDFRKADTKTVAYTQKEGTADARARSILTAVDKLDRKVRGTRFSYDLLCEFLHPNVGDLFAATAHSASSADMHGTIHITRCISLRPQSLTNLPDIQRATDRLLDVCSDVVQVIPGALIELEAAATVADRITKKYAHNVLKKHRSYFLRNDLCPCLSGLKVKDCASKVHTLL